MSEAFIDYLYWRAILEAIIMGLGLVGVFGFIVYLIYNRDKL